MLEYEVFRKLTFYFSFHLGIVSDSQQSLQLRTQDGSPAFVRLPKPLDSH